jgi:membrane protein DedA with SNARE-associated domain
MLAEVVRQFTEWVTSLISSGGVVGIFLVALMENLFPPTPSEFLYPLAGKMAYDGVLTIAEVIAAGVLGTLVGATILYFLGYRLGSRRARAFFVRYGTLRIGRLRWAIFTGEMFDQAMGQFERYGGAVVMFGRILPLVHGIVSVPAGITRMNLFRFYVYTALGSAAWIGTLVVLGYLLGTQWTQILVWLDVYQNVIVVLMALAAAAFFLRHWSLHRQAEAERRRAQLDRGTA